MDRMQWVSEFARLARLNGKRSREAKKRKEYQDSHWFQGRACAYLTAARMLKGSPSPVHIRKIATMAGRA